MENLYPSLSERNYRQDFWRLAIRFLPEAKNLPAQKQQDFVNERIPSLPDAQKLALIQRELWACFDECIDEAHKQVRGRYSTLYKFVSGTPYLKGEPIISTDEEFEAFFLAYLHLIENFSIESSLFIKYNLPTQDLQEILDVERYILRQKLQNLYQSYQQDISTILEQITKVKHSFKEVAYEMPYFGLSFRIAYEEDSTIEMPIKADNELSIYLNQPILIRTFASDLNKRLAEAQEALAQHRAKSQIAIARYDLQNIIENYQQQNKLTQTVRMDSEIEFAVGKIQLTIDTRVYWQNSAVAKGLIVSFLLGGYWAIDLLIKGYLVGGVSMGALALLAFVWLIWKSNR